MRGKKESNLQEIEKLMEENPDDWFSPEETDRRLKEVMGRMAGRPRAMNLKTGQSLQPPFLSEDELKERGYPCEWDCE